METDFNCFLNLPSRNPTLHELVVYSTGPRPDNRRIDTLGDLTACDLRLARAL